MAELNIEELLKEADSVLEVKEQPEREPGAQEIPDPSEGVPDTGVGPASNTQQESANKTPKPPPIITEQQVAALAEQSQRERDYVRRSTPFGEDDADWMARNDNPPWWNLSKQSGRAMAWLLRNPGNAAAQTVVSPSRAYEGLFGSRPGVFGKNTLGEPGAMVEALTTSKGLQRASPIPIGDEPSYFWDAAEIAGPISGIASQIGRRALLNQSRQMAKANRVSPMKPETFDYLPEGKPKNVAVGGDDGIRAATEKGAERRARESGGVPLFREATDARPVMQRIKDIGGHLKSKNWKAALDELDALLLSPKRGLSEAELAEFKKLRGSILGGNPDNSRSPTLRAILDRLKVGKAGERAKQSRQLDVESSAANTKVRDLENQFADLKAGKSALAKQYHNVEREILDRRLVEAQEALEKKYELKRMRIENRNPPKDPSKLEAFEKRQASALEELEASKEVDLAKTKLRIENTPRGQLPELEEWGMAMKMTDQELKDVNRALGVAQKEGSKLASARRAIDKSKWSALQTAGAFGALGAGLGSPAAIAYYMFRANQNRNQ